MFLLTILILLHSISAALYINSQTVSSLKRPNWSAMSRSTKRKLLVSRVLGLLVGVVVGMLYQNLLQLTIGIIYTISLEWVLFLNSLNIIRGRRVFYNESIGTIILKYLLPVVSIITMIILMK